MEGYIVSARKYRPDTFESVVGQSHITLTLKNAIVTEQLAHAFLFSGPRWVGKTTCARILARAINCTALSADGEPCNQCDSCKAFLEGRSLNIHELDAASNNSVDDIRNIIEQVRYIPTTGRKSVFIIDEVHMLSTAAFNAFLKTLEEPPPHAIFILATTERHKILPTILSRCQKFDFRRIKVDDIANHLKHICETEGLKYEFEGLQVISLKADGALRDALSIFDQIVSFSQRNVTFQIVQDNLNILDADYYFRAVDLALAQDHTGLLLLLNDVVERGFDSRDFLVGLNEHYRNLLMCRTPQTVKLIETSDNVRQRYLEQSKSIDPTLLLNSFNLCTEADQKLKLSSNQRLAVELALARLCFVQQAVNLAEGLLSGGLEKKKELSKPHPFVTAETVLKVEAPPPPVALPVPEPKTVSKSATPGVPPVVEKRSSTRNKLSIPKGLDDIDITIEKKSDASEGEDEVTAFDASIVIDGEAFYKALGEIAEEYNSQNKPRMASLLKMENCELQGNRWVLYLDNEVSKKTIQEERSLVPLVRERLNQPLLFISVEVREATASTMENMPMTNSQKLDKMKEKNPALQTFIQKFEANLGV
jgi:DNA polymerase III subunit gamma/tau